MSLFFVPFKNGFSAVLWFIYIRAKAKAKATSFLTCRIVSDLCIYTTVTAVATNIKEKNRFRIRFCSNINEPLWYCLHITSKRSEVPLTKTVTLMVRENESLPVSPIFSFLCELLSVFVSLLRLVVFVLLPLPEALPDKEYKFNANKPFAKLFIL